MILLNNDEMTELFKSVVGQDFWNKANKELNSTKGVLFLEYDESQLPTPKGQACKSLS